MHIEEPHSAIVEVRPLLRQTLGAPYTITSTMIILNYHILNYAIFQNLHAHNS